MAGQGVMLKLPGCSGPTRMHSIASTPYESRRDSSLLSASLIEVVAERGASEEDAVLAELAPGSELE
ncbi:FAD-binding FR-type domain-containing protein, partial [Haematococcus lacustris]